MKILLISGHGAGDSGAVGNGSKEADLTIEVVKSLQSKLKGYATVDLYDVSRNAYQDLKKGSFSIGKYDYVLEVHFNASNADEGDGKIKGAEIYVTPKEKGTSVEQKILSNLSKYLTNRGVKVRGDLAVINKVKNKYGISSALLEVCFIDDYDDMKVYKSQKDNIIQAIANGVISGFGLKSSNSTSNSVTTKSKNTTTKKVEYLSCEGSYDGGSIVQALNKIGVDSSYSYRSKLAKANGINDYSGRAYQNETLLKLLKKGKLKKA